MESNKSETKRLRSDPSRTIAFSDGVFAIAITLLVLELIAVLHVREEAGIIQLCVMHWQSFVAFTIGFITILICWINHHTAFEHIVKIDTNLMWINGFLLFVVTITPFPTAILAEHMESDISSALTIFGFNYILISIAADAICTYAYNRKLIEEDSRTFYNDYKIIYRYAIVYNAIAFLFCFVSVIIPVIMYVILFAFFAAPKVFAMKIHRIRTARRSAAQRPS